MNTKEAREQLENTDQDCVCKECEIAREVLKDLPNKTSTEEEK